MALIYQVPFQGLVSGTYPLLHPTAIGNPLNQSVNLTMRNNIHGPGAKGGTVHWNWERRAGEGPNGLDFLRFKRWEDIGETPDTGWFGGNSTIGDIIEGLMPGPFYFRLRLRIQTVITPNGGFNSGMKWFIFAGPGLANGEARMIFFVYGGENGSSNPATHFTIQARAGVSGNFATMDLPYSANFYNIQVGWLYGTGGVPYLKIWEGANNENEANHNAIHTAFTADGMGGTYPVPAPQGQPGDPTVDSTFVCDIAQTNSQVANDVDLDTFHWELGNTFDNAWNNLDGEPPSNFGTVKRGRQLRGIGGGI